jgi:poly(3-hydroxybutyrate) depolymerase
MKRAATNFLMSGFTMLLLACAHSVTEGSVDPHGAELVFSNLEIDQTNRGTISINGYDRHFSVTFPTSYDDGVAYPVVLFFHGCMCRPNVTDETILRYLDWKPRLEPYREDFITIKVSSFSEKKPAVPQ